MILRTLIIQSAADKNLPTNSARVLVADDEDHKIRIKKIDQLLQEIRETKNQIEKRTTCVTIGADRVTMQEVEKVSLNKSSSSCV